MDLLAPPSKSASPTSNDTGIQTLEGYILPLLRQAPIFLNNLHFNTRIHPECYLDLVDLPYYDKNNGKHHSENIGTSRVGYVLYPNGIVSLET